MTNTNKVTKKFGLNLACNMAADCLRENIAPASIVLANLIVLQKADTFPKELQKEFFKRPQNLAADDVRVIRQIMEAMRSPNNGVVDLLYKAVEAGWAFKKAPPVEAKHVFKKTNHNGKPQQKKKSYVAKPTSAPTVVIKRSQSST